MLKKFLSMFLVGYMLMGGFSPSALFAYTDALATKMPGDLKCTDLKLGGNDVLDSNGTTRLTVGSTNSVVGDLSVSGTVTGSNYATVASSGSFTHRILMGQTTAISTFTPTALTLDDGLTLTVNGPTKLDGTVGSNTASITISTHIGVTGDVSASGVVSSEDSLVDDAAIHETLYLGLTTAISSFTPTAITLDDGLTLTANGTLNVNGNMTSTGADVTIATNATISGTLTLSGGLILSDPYSATETELKASTPTVVGQMYWDETNLAMIVSTGITNCASFGLIYNGALAPTGW